MDVFLNEPKLKSFFSLYYYYIYRNHLICMCVINLMQRARWSMKREREGKTGVVVVGKR